MATVPNDVDEVRRRMAEIRRELHEDVRDVVATASAATDWKGYLTMYPWVTVGVAFAVGYFIVPRRHRTTRAIEAAQADLTKVRKTVESLEEREEPKAKKRGKGLLGAALGMLTPLVLKAAQGYALKYAEQWIMQQQMAAHQAGPDPAGFGPFPGYPSSGGGPAGGMGPSPGPGRPSGGPRRGGPGSA